MTLLETVIAIVIGLVILAGIGTLVYRSTETNKVAVAYSQLSMITNNLHNLYSGTSQTPSTSIADYINAGIFPENMISGSSTAIDPWGGKVVIGAYSTTGLWLTLYSVPKADCINLSQKLSAIASNNEVDINGRGVVSPSLSAAEAYCTSNSNYIGPLILLIGGG